jgi:hypothetical protein
MAGSGSQAYHLRSTDSGTYQLPGSAVKLDVPGGNEPGYRSRHLRKLVAWGAGLATVLGIGGAALSDSDIAQRVMEGLNKNKPAAHTTGQAAGKASDVYFGFTKNDYIGPLNKYIAKCPDFGYSPISETQIERIEHIPRSELAKIAQGKNGRSAREFMKDYGYSEGFLVRVNHGPDEEQGYYVFEKNDGSLEVFRMK